MTLRDLTLGAEYLFVLIGFDADGDYSAVFSLNTNMLRMRVIAPGTGGPRMTVFGEGLFKTFPTGGIDDTLFTASLKAPARDPVQIRWSGQPGLGSSIVGYRWAIDIADVNDPRRRAGPWDVRHWSRWSLTETSATVTPLLPLPPSLSRRLFIEALDSSGFKSRVIVKVEFLTVRRDRQLLVVNDTRLQPEILEAGGIVRPVGNWPNLAELDSFLVAHGGFPYQGYPAGTLSAPGLFAGYDFDVYRTRSTSLDKTVPLDLLMRYKNVVWITDGNANLSAPSGGAYALRYMSSPGRQNTLAPYVGAGGRLWLLGGGAAFAMCKDLFDSPSNNVFTFVYSSATGELVPGRPMYDFVHWRSEISTWVAPMSSVRPARTAATGTMGLNYSRLPATLTGRTPTTDPLPPLRTPASFYGAAIPVPYEYLSQPNSIVESCSPWPEHGRTASTLDTLYTVRPVFPPTHDMPCMTVYHGRDNGQVVFMGFDLWSWSRPQGRAVVDAVLTDLWHLTTTTEASGIATIDDVGKGEDDARLIRR